MGLGGGGYVNGLSAVLGCPTCVVAVFDDERADKRRARTHRLVPIVSFSVRFVSAQITFSTPGRPLSSGRRLWF